MTRFTVAAMVLTVAAPAARAQDALGVRAVAFSADGKFLAAGTGEPKEPGTVTPWDAASRKQLWVHKEHSGAPAVAFSPDGRTLAAATYANAVRLLDVGTGQVKATLKHPQVVRAVAYSPDGKRLATACWDRLVRVWDVE